MKSIGAKRYQEVRYCIRKVIAFFIIYGVSAVILEGIIIGAYSVLGYNIMQGQMPVGEWVDRVPFYGMIGFSVATLFYVTRIEKRTLSDIGLQWKMKFLLGIGKGVLLGSGMVAVVIGILVVSGLGNYQGVGSISMGSFFLWALAYAIQSFSEEIMCRGFLQSSLVQRVSSNAAIALTSIVFMLPHLSGVLEMGGVGTLVSITNLLMISWLLSLIKIREGCLGASFGLHFGWNFCLGILFGLGVSGSSQMNGVIRIAVNSKYSIFTGGVYGIEASIIVMAELIVGILIYSTLLRRTRRNGI